MTKVSIIIPVFRERESIMPLLERLSSVIDGDYEVIFVDDGSDDGTEAPLSEAVKKNRGVRVLFMGRRLGKGTALLAGYAAASGEVLVTLDADLQNPPEEVPKLLSALEGAHLVVGWRKKRSDSSSRRIQSALYNAALRLLAGSPFHDINCGFRAFRREILNNESLFTDRHRLFPLLVHSAGYSTKEVAVSHSPRRFGRSKFGLGRVFSAFADVVVATILRFFSKRPSLALTIGGSVSGLLGALILGYLLIVRIMTGSIHWRYPLLAAGVVSLVVGVQLVLTGFLVESISSGRRRPPPPLRVLPEDEK